MNSSGLVRNHNFVFPTRPRVQSAQGGLARDPLERRNDHPKPTPTHLLEAEDESYTSTREQAWQMTSLIVVSDFKVLKIQDGSSLGFGGISHDSMVKYRGFHFSQKGSFSYIDST